MSFSHTITKTYTTNAGTAVSAADAYSSNSESNFEDTIAASTNKEVDLAATLANIKCFAIYSSKAITLYTNASDGTGGNTISIPAGVLVCWGTKDVYANIFTHDITKLFFSNGAGATASVKFRMLFDSEV